MGVSELRHNVLSSSSLRAWTRRRTPLFVLVAVSFAWILVDLLGSVEWKTRGVFQFWPSYCQLFEQLWSVVCFLLEPLCMYALLNLILMSIVVKSGVLAHSNVEKAPVRLSKLHQLELSKTPLDELVTMRSRYSSRSKQDSIDIEQKFKKSFSTTKNIQIHGPVFSPSTSQDTEGQEKLSVSSPSANPPLSMPMAEQKAFRKIPSLPSVESPLSASKKDAFLATEDVDSVGRSDEQLVEIRDIEVEDMSEEISGEELNRRAEAFILKIHSSWRLQNIQWAN